jgi:hypothetical protein
MNRAVPSAVFLVLALNRMVFYPHILLTWTGLYRFIYSLSFIFVQFLAPFHPEVGGNIVPQNVGMFDYFTM